MDFSFCLFMMNAGKPRRNFMEVLMINGSCHEKGCTYTALNEIAKVLEAEGIESEIVCLGNQPIRDCSGCGGCRNHNGCVFTDDVVHSLAKKAKEADGFIFGTPAYYAHPSGRILSVLDRLSVSARQYLSHKPGAVIASARRAGTTASLDALAKHLGILEMPVITSSYWNMVHGNTPEEVLQDLEGLQTMRNLGRNMAWMLRCIEAGKKEGIDVPISERGAKTNFIRSS